MPSPRDILRSAAFIAALAVTAAVTVATACRAEAVTVVGEWSFDEGSGQTVADTSGGVAHDGVLGDTPGVDPEDPTFVPGLSGTALGFDGSQKVRVARHADLEPAQTITVEAYARHPGSAPGNDRNIISKTLGPGRSSYALYTASNPGVIGFYVSVQTAHVQVIDGTFDWTADDDWHHFVGSYDGVNARLFVDGVLKGTTPVGGSIFDIDYNAGDLFFGSFRGNPIDSPNFNWTGELDGVRIFADALTPAEIAALDAVPEPSSLALLSALAALTGAGLRSRRAARRPRS